MTTNTPDPIENNVERVLVRQTATGFEQGIAAGAGFFTAGPLGALCAWGTIRGLQGKWAPWTILGIIGAPVCVGIQLVGLGVVGAALSEYDAPSRDQASAVVESAPVAPAAAPSLAPSDIFDQNTQEPRVAPVAGRAPTKPANQLTRGECLFPNGETGQSDVLVGCTVTELGGAGEYAVEIENGLLTIVHLYEDGSVQFQQEGRWYPGWATEFPNNAVRVTDSDGYTFVF